MADKSSLTVSKVLRVMNTCPYQTMNQPYAKTTNVAMMLGNIVDQAIEAVSKEDLESNEDTLRQSVKQTLFMNKQEIIYKTNDPVKNDKKLEEYGYCVAAEAIRHPPKFGYDKKFFQLNFKSETLGVHGRLDYYDKDSGTLLEFKVSNNPYLAYLQLAITGLVMEEMGETINRLAIFQVLKPTTGFIDTQIVKQIRPFDDEQRGNALKVIKVAKYLADSQPRIPGIYSCNECMFRDSCEVRLK